MKRFAFLICFVFSSLMESVAFAESSQHIEGTREHLVIGVFPRRSPADTVKNFTPLAKYLESQLNHPVKLVTSKNYSIFSQSLYRNEFDLVHLNQYDYIKLNEKLGYKVIAQNEEFGHKTIRASLFARKDSDINKLEDLRGKKVGFGGSKQAMISYVIPTLMLHEAGLKRGTDYIEQIVRNPLNTIFNNYTGIVDASAAGNRVLALPAVKNHIDISKFKVIASSKDYSHLPWAINDNLKPEIKEKVKSILLNLDKSPKGQAVLKSAVLTGLNPASDEDYDSFREVIKKLEMLDSPQM
ncbi:phosphate/phosphite/phosphonate ABC transporter substrate-binding protein [Neptuniibacter sp. QD37_6]|uniref:phosphate/phosphite/phosphonate ABC transporter substrate-binding protein n=1 Tax=Neptuniibacter sp. QD37_6 TaxID=3398210 RepID=UPI0039F55516